MRETTKKRILNDIFMEVLKNKINVQDTIKLAFEEGFNAGKGENEKSEEYKWQTSIKLWVQLE